MNIDNLFKPTYSIAALRMMMGIVFLLHAGVRIYNNTLPGFGDFLQGKGFPFGFYLAWAVTLFELAGGILMFFRFFCKNFLYWGNDHPYYGDHNSSQRKWMVRGWTVTEWS